MNDLLEQLINIRSITGEEKEIGEFLTQLLKDKGYHVSQQPVDESRFNIIASTGKTPRVLFCTHIDTVAPFVPYRREGDVVFGRGACDAKGVMVSMITAGDRLLEKKFCDFGFLFVVGEEHRSDGAKKAAELSLGSKYVILGEPSQNKFVIAQKGVLIFKARAKGKAAHSAYPEKGESAIHHLVDALHEWQHADWGEDEVFGKTTLNIGKISAGSAVNVIADSATAEGIFRIAHSLELVKSKLLAYGNHKLEIKILSASEPLRMGSIDGFETIVASGASDAPYLRPLGDVYLIGPGSIEFAHSDNEHISTGEMEEAVSIYMQMAREL